MFYIVGPTASGKSELAADVAVKIGAEIVNADAFQIYEGFNILSAKPDAATLGKVPHHLIGVVPAHEEMSAAKYRDLALPVIADIIGRGKLPVIVGGSGLYVKALTHGLDNTPEPDAALRQQLNGLSLDELQDRLTDVDPAAVGTVDLKNRRRVIRAIEIAELSGLAASAQRTAWKTRSGGKAGAGQSGIGFQPMISDSSAGSRCHYSGILVFRDRDELYSRINQRVEAMLDSGAIDEVRNAGPLGSTVSQMIGIRPIQQYLGGGMSLAESISRIQQYSRRYAKRQLTWFRHQTNLESLNLSLLSHNEAVEWVIRPAIVGRTHGE